MLRNLQPGEHEVEQEPARNVLVGAMGQLAVFDDTQTAPAKVLNLPTAIARIFGGERIVLPQSLSALVVAVAICLPFFALAFLLKETKQLRDIGGIVFASVQLSYLSVVLTYIDVNINIFGRLRRNIIPLIASKQDLAELTACIELATTRKYLPSISLLGTVVGLTALVGGTLAYFISDGSNPGFGLPVGAIVFGCFGGISLHYLIWVLKLTRVLGNLDFSISEFIPVRSRVIHEITGMLNTHIYIVALFTAVVTVVDYQHPYTAWFVGVDVLLGWLPIIAQFLLTQQAVRKIIAKAKWKTFEEIQSEIRALRNSGHLKDKRTTDAVNRLMDLHDRIEKTGDSTLDLKAGLQFLNQLMLPVLSWAIVSAGQLKTLIESLFSVP